MSRWYCLDYWGISFGADFTSFDGVTFSLFVISGLLILFCANALNEIIEKDTDLLMDRTKSVPLPTSAMTVSEALIAAGESWGSWDC